MGKFIYVFELAAKEELIKKGYALYKEDSKNNVWVFINASPDQLEFSLNYPHVLSNVVSF